MINKRFLKNDYIAKISILSDREFIGIAKNFVLGYAKMFGFTGEEYNKIELMTEEALISTISHASDSEVLEPLDITISYLPGEFILSIQDKGIPVDMNMLESSDDTYMSVLLMKNLADKFKFINLGKNGKKIQLIKYVKGQNIADYLAGSEEPETEGVSIESCDTPKIRLINPGESTMLSRLAFRTYGYTYASDFYYPEKLSELFERKLLVSAVCVNSENEIVGNLSLMYEKPDSKVADSGAAMVDPRYRGHNLFKKMKVFLSNYASETGMYGIYSEAVTIHPYTQKGNISLGAKVTGIMLAFAKENITFKKIADGVSIGQRQAVVLYYLKTNKEPHRRVFTNLKFHDVIRKIYSGLDFDRELVCVQETDHITPHADISEVYTLVKPDLNTAIIKLKTIGKDAFSIISSQLKQFCLKKIDAIYLEFPLSEPYSASLIEKAGRLGFIFSGILPELYDGDVIALQYLNNVSVNPDKITLVSPLAIEILKVIMADYKLQT